MNIRGDKMVKRTLEDKIDEIERDIDELKSEVALLKSLINGIYSLETSGGQSPRSSGAPYTTDDFVPSLDKSSRIDKDSYRLYRTARESNRKV